MADRVTRPKRVEWSGPLSEFGPGFTGELQRLGFTPLSVVHQSRLAAHLSRWMQDQGLEVGQLTSDRIDEFLVERRTTHTNRYSRRSLSTLLGFLTRLGVLPVDEPAEQTPSEQLATEFERYLVSERGLLPRTAAAQEARVQRFLAQYCPPSEVGALSTAEITAALLAEDDHHAVASVKRLGYTLRSFLRYAFLMGLIDQDLSGASIPVRAHQASLLPIGISRERTTALLAACDRDSVVGRRDYAVILLLARLGLRATEVAGLQLDDIDWHHGEITVRGKGRRDERMPLSAEVGEALAPRPCPTLADHLAQQPVCRRRGRHPTTAANTKTSAGAHVLADWWPAQAEDYLRLRRSLGFKLAWEAHLLVNFTADLASRNVRVVTVADAVAWSLALPAGQTHRPLTRASVRLTAIRGFGTYLHSLDPAHEIPPRAVFRCHKTRPAPYIYTDEQVRALLDACASMIR